MTAKKMSSVGLGDRAAVEVIEAALSEIEAKSSLQTDGIWLEHLIVRVAPFVREWDVSECWRWPDWPNREAVVSASSAVDLGIDVVARRRSDGAWIAIQAKSRQLDCSGHGSPVNARELDSFLAAAADGSIWAERWLVVNGAVALGGHAPGKAAMAAVPVTVENVKAALVRQRDAMSVNDDSEHCRDPDGYDSVQSRDSMQDEAVETSVRLLRAHADSDSGGSPFGEARGRIILPCGTGKTRIALRIVERLTLPRQVSIVLCPSIALVAQTRREFLQHSVRPLRALAVCSDETAGYSPAREGAATRAEDPTADNSNVSATEVKGLVTTDSEVIADWMIDRKSDDSLSVVFGTYQSAARIADALKSPAVPELSMLICDEAHRTAGLRRVKNADRQDRIENFLLCHDQEAFPATFRVYLTATPRIYDMTGSTSPGTAKPGDLLVRSMSDPATFGVELFRKSYLEAVNNRWLADYRIIALALSSPKDYELANELARDAESEGISKLTSMDFLRGLAFALAMAGATRSPGLESDVALSSAIGFLNTVKKSETMARYLQTDKVRRWINDRTNGSASRFVLEHIDAKHNVASRDNAKSKLADASSDEPFGVLNVGIFGEGTDSPTLSAVAFLESRKSPVDVVQAVGRAMRSAPGKQLGYIVVPVVIPLNADPETHLAHSRPEEGWSELGQILLALRAHDTRIEDELAELLMVRVPPIQDELKLRSITYVAVAAEGKRIRYGVHVGAPGEAEMSVRSAAASGRPLAEFGINPVLLEEWTDETEPTRVVSGKALTDGSVEVRADAVVRDKLPSGRGGLGQVNAAKTKKAAAAMINKGAGTPVQPRRPGAKRKTAHERDEAQAQRMLESVGSLADSITVNLLARSGLTRDRVGRDLNVLQESVTEAAHHLRDDGLAPALDKHFGLDNLASDKRKSQADGCTIAALLMMNAAMLHQRIAAGGWLRNIESLVDIKNAVKPVDRLEQNWERITRQDFLPVIEPAREAVYAAKNTGRLAGLERALSHTAGEAERIAETYADMGADHAGPLFNKVMGNQASDGAFFTRPPAATIAARLALDACGEQDWTDPEVWSAHKSVDLACGSGTLLAALLNDLKRRASEQGATVAHLAHLQRVAVETMLKGMDINAVSLQLAATQLTAGNNDVKYRNMGLYHMPYGPTGDPTVPTSAGTLELLAEDDVLPRPQTELFGRSATGTALRLSLGDPVVEDAAKAATGARIVIMNPPFTAREKMGEKFSKTTQRALWARMDMLDDYLTAADPGLSEFLDKNSLGPRFAALAERCIDSSEGVLCMVLPTVATANRTGVHERLVLADRFDVLTLLTCHQPGNINLSQNTSINESIVVLRRRDRSIGGGGGGGPGGHQKFQPPTPPRRRVRGGSTIPGAPKPQKK
ncbi:MAG: DEAD/DEAH box helicase family protein, partial [Acidimicrobiaceae bacterium]|nr:DEAD/DEAH box helicase family protein [Acidimicrobiaceae bacterium]